MTSPSAKIARQLEELRILQTQHDTICSDAYDQISQVDVAQSMLDRRWENFQCNHFEIVMLSDGVESPDYFPEIHYHRGESLYFQARVKLADIRSRLQTPLIIDMPTLSFDSKGDRSSRRLLPKINLPTFSGSYDQWLPFHDQFTALVADDTLLSPVEKLHYLKGCVTGDAAALIAHVPITADTYIVAWEKLVNRFENKRFIVAHALRRLFDLSVASRRSSTHIRHLLSVVTETTAALESLAVNTLDSFLVHFITSRLDGDTREAWEHSLGNASAVPTYEALAAYLDGRARSLEALQGTPSPPAASSVAPRTRTPPRSVHLANPIHTPAFRPCPLCPAQHSLASCPVFMDKPIALRRDYIESNRRCHNCLRSHPTSACLSSYQCQRCSDRHHTSLHDGDAPHPSPPLSDINPSSASSHHASHSQPPAVLLATALVGVTNSLGHRINLRALLDPGSEISLVTERVARHLRLPRHPAHVAIGGVAGSKAATAHSRIVLHLQSLVHPEQSISTAAYVLPSLSQAVPSNTIPPGPWPHLHDLSLADPFYLQARPIDLILGVDVVAPSLGAQLIRGGPGMPIAQASTFGWLISGPTTGPPHNAVSQTFTIQPLDNAAALLRDVWSPENPSQNSDPNKSYSREENDCENHFASTYTRDASSRYTVRLPFRLPPYLLGHTFNSALRIHASLQRKLRTTNDLLSLYGQFLDEYASLGHLTPTPIDQLHQRPHFYLPHHGVLRTVGGRPKLRVVFNGSHPSSSGLSLNDLLHIGPKLQTGIPDVLTEFRRHRYAFTADITKMYRQILIHPHDRRFQRILWGQPTAQAFTLNTVTYGLSCAPYLALRVLQQLIDDHGSSFPLAIPSMTRGRYVDNLFGGADDIAQCRRVAQQASDLCRAGCFPLHEWATNHPCALPASMLNDEAPAALPLLDDDTIRTLGLLWLPQSDSFTFRFTPALALGNTKRLVLSQVAKIFDPLGFLAPVTIRAKIFMQRLWCHGLGWDEPLPASLQDEWASIFSQLPSLDNVLIPRWLGPPSSSSTQLHGFSDASKSALSAVIYLRILTEAHVIISLVCAKTKVTPLRPVTIPRLELMAASMLTRLAAFVTRSLELSDVPVFLWTDSSVALSWIKGKPQKWKEFVRNRVQTIQTTLPHARWRFVESADNPADCASRGIPGARLPSHPLWWTGPAWLAQPPDRWPPSANSPEVTDPPEERLLHVAVATTLPLEPDLFARFSSLTQLTRITARCLGFISRLRNPSTDAAPMITTSTLQSSLKTLARVSQQRYFDTELRLLAGQPSLPPSNPLAKFNPYVDREGLLRIGGRLNFSTLPDAEKHPLLIAKSSLLAPLLIRDAHHRCLHGGTTLTITTLRQRFWIIGGRPRVRAEVLRCVVCARHRGQRAQQLMGQLPPSRTTISRPFHTSSLDYAGPVPIRTWKGRGARTTSAYICVFTCMATGAIHLELVSDYTAAAFLAAFRRFASRRGVPTTLHSDCGTTFVGANSQLHRDLRQVLTQWPSLRDSLLKDGTDWHFSPPSAPHFNGRAEAGVKSVKHHLRRTLTSTPLTFEELTTVLTDIEAVLNSRPLGVITEDMDDVSVLTPGHFLTGGPLKMVPVPNLSDVAINRLKRWQLLSALVQQFWKRWSHEYLQQLQARTKWRSSQPNIKSGDVVLVVDDRYPPAKWPLGLVVDVYPGVDDLTRVVTVRTASSYLRRPITKLCRLPVTSESDPITSSPIDAAIPSNAAATT